MHTHPHKHTLIKYFDTLDPGVCFPVKLFFMCYKALSCLTCGLLLIIVIVVVVLVVVVIQVSLHKHYTRFS